MSTQYYSRELNSARKESGNSKPGFLKTTFMMIFKIYAFPILFIELVATWIWEFNSSLYNDIIPTISKDVSSRVSILLFGTDNNELAAQLNDLNLSFDENAQFRTFNVDNAHGGIIPSNLYSRQIFDNPEDNSMLQRVHAQIMLMQRRFNENRKWLIENADDAVQFTGNFFNEKAQEILELSEKSDYIFDRYVAHAPFCVLNKFNPNTEKMVYSFKGQQLTKDEGFQDLKKKKVTAAYLHKEHDVAQSSLRTFHLVRKSQPNVDGASNVSYQSYSSSSIISPESTNIFFPTSKENSQLIKRTPKVLKSINANSGQNVGTRQPLLKSSTPTKIPTRHSPVVTLKKEKVKYSPKSSPFKKNLATPSRSNSKSQAIQDQTDNSKPNNELYIPKVAVKNESKSLNFFISEKQINTFKIKYSRKNKNNVKQESTLIQPIEIKCNAGEQNHNTRLTDSEGSVNGTSHNESFIPHKKEVDYEKIRNAIKGIFSKADFDDGSLAPVILRLAWHSCATYDKFLNTGGSNGATMRFLPELTDESNTGLDVPRMALESIKQQFPEITYSDLWTLAGVTAIEAMGGPNVKWIPGRIDCTDFSKVPPNGRLPLGYKNSVHIRDTFGRMGFNDQETVALLGAHALGRCHKKYSGWDGAWTRDPIKFSNEFYTVLTEEKWELGIVPETKREQYYNEDKSLMMLNTDMELIRDPNFIKWTKLYAEDEAAFFKDFSDAFAKLLELGITRSETGDIIYS